MLWVALPLTALVAGMIHTVTGFGSGIIMMLVFPYFLNMVVGAALSSSINFFLSLALTWKFRRQVRTELILYPVIPYILCSTGAIMSLKHLDMRLLAVAFGGFLVLLAAYFLFVAGKVALNPSKMTAVLCGAISGVCAGLFGIGGPLMALYFLSVTDSKESYTGNLQFCFTCSCLCNTLTRVSRGIYTLDLIPMTILGLLAINVGKSLGLKVLDKLDADLVRKIVYLFVGLSGALTMVQNLAG